MISKLTREQIGFLLFSLVLLVSTLWLLKYLSVTLLAALLMAYWTAPWLQYWRECGPRYFKAWVVSTFVGVCVVLFIITGWFVPKLIADVTELVKLLPQSASQARDGMQALLDGWAVGVVLPTFDQSLLSTLSTQMQQTSWSSLSGSLASMIQYSLSGVSHVLLLLVNLILFPLMYYYMLVHQTMIKRFCVNLFPPRHHEVLGQFFLKAHSKFAGFMRGQLLVCTLSSAYYAFALSLLGIKAGLLIGVLIGFLNVIPLLGISIGFFLSLLLCQGTVTFGVTLGITAMLLLGYVLEQFYLVPMLIADKLKLNALEMLWAVLIFGHIGGLVGVILALPLAAVLKLLLTLTLDFYQSTEFYTKGSSDVFS